MMLQGRLEQLPAELWAKVLQQLSIQSLLQARQVSRQFVCLSHRLQLDLSWDTLPVAKGSSLALFIRRNCSRPTSPQVQAKITASTAALWPSIMLATECSNLISLDCSNQWLNQLEAEACLRLLPSTLESLELDTTFCLISDPSLQRLKRLTCLSLSGSCAADFNEDLNAEPAISAAGLQCLQGLEVFKVTSHADDGSHDWLDPASFLNPSLTRLELARDIFKGHLSLAGLPALHDIAIYTLDALPTWLMGQPFPRLEIWGVDQLTSCSPDKLLFNQLGIMCEPDDPDWLVHKFLDMPCLTQLEALANPGEHLDEATPIKMLGSHHEHQKLLQRVPLTLNYPLQLQLSLETNVPLRKNGHAVICVCSACLQADVISNRPLH